MCFDKFLKFLEMSDVKVNNRLHKCKMNFISLKTSSLNINIIKKSNQIFFLIKIYQRVIEQNYMKTELLQSNFWFSRKQRNEHHKLCFAVG
jgi:ABC-type protease/lipase transport system fused ATPase/permease subunit